LRQSGHLYPAQASQLGKSSKFKNMGQISAIAICYYYSARKLILVLPSHGGWKAEST